MDTFSSIIQLQLIFMSALLGFLKFYEYCSFQNQLHPEEKPIFIHLAFAKLFSTKFS